jgi:acylglycerol lipase
MAIANEEPTAKEEMFDSVGGLKVCLENQAELAGFICESFAFQVPAPGFALAAIKGLSHVGPRLPVLKLKNEDFSRDPKAVEATLPLFIMHGTGDKATICHGSEFFYKTAGSNDKTLKLYEGHYHDLLNDYGKEGVVADITAWIDKRVAA